MKQYYQFMLRGVVTDDQGLQTNANIDEFEEDLHKMLVVRLNPVYLLQSIYALLKFKLNVKDHMVIPTSATVFVGLLWLHAQLDPDVAAAASGLAQLKEPIRGGVELHQGHHSLHPRRGGPVWEAFLVSPLPENKSDISLCGFHPPHLQWDWFVDQSLNHSSQPILREFYLYKNEDCSALCSDIAGMLLKSTGEFLDAGLQKSGNEFWESADDSTASDEIR